MISNAPNGFFIEDLLLFSGIVTKKKEWRVAAGFKIYPAVLTGASNQTLNDFHDMMEVLLASLGQQYELQVQWHVDADYSSELDRYEEETRKAAADKRLLRWGEVTRVGRIERYRNLMEKRILRRQHLELYVVTKILVPRRIKQATVQPLLQSIEREMQIAHSTLNQIFFGGAVYRMKTEDLYLAYLHHVNPSVRYGFLAGRDRQSLIDGFAPELSIQENCWKSDAMSVQERGEGIEKEGVAFYLDGYYFNIFSITRWPNNSYIGITNILTDQAILDYSITVKITPLPVDPEIRAREKLAKRLEGEAVEGSRRSVKTALAKNWKTIDDLASGALFPFKVGYTIMVWADNRDELSSKSSILKKAIQTMGAAQYYQTSAKGAARRLFFETWPGWTGGSYTYREIYATQDYLGPLLPMSATFTGKLQDCEAIYDGGAYNLVGVKLFDGSTPLHSCVFGMTRGGKSNFVVDLISQIQPYLRYTVIVEEGLSYGTFTRAMGCKPIVVRPDGSLTINAFDTLGMPLTSTHLSGVTALALNMVGTSGDLQLDNYRKSLLSDYINQLYNDYYETWKQANEERFVDLAREAVALNKLRQSMAQGKNTPLEAFAHWQELIDRQDPFVDELFGSVTEGEAVAFANEAATETFVRNLVFAKFSTTEFPVLSSLAELMASGMARAHNADEVRRMSDLLGSWTSERENGPLFDGYTNVSLYDAVAHFELGEIPESNKQLKQLAAFLIANYARQRIISLPRAVKKAVVFEELARFVNIPGGDVVVSETYAQLGKFSCTVMAITQVYGQFRRLGIRGTITGNSRNFFMLPLKDFEDVNDLGDTIGLPLGTRDIIRKCPLPLTLPPENRYGCVNFFSIGEDNPVNGMIHNYVTPEMLYAASSSGDVFDKREEELAGTEEGDEVVEKILDIVYSREKNLKPVAVENIKKPVLT
jgi:type IV secretion system protein TrbE